MKRRLLSLKRKIDHWLKKSPWVQRFQVLWGALGLAVFSLLVSYLIFRLGYAHSGLSAVTLDQAQLARNLANGKGFYTSVLRPHALPFFGANGLAPDFSNAPLYPLLLALSFSVLGPHDGTVTLFSLLVHGATIGLLFILATRLAGQHRWVPVLAVLVYALSQPVLVLATSGTPLVLSSCLLLVLLLALTPAARAADLAAPGPTVPGASGTTSGPGSSKSPRTARVNSTDKSLLLAGGLAGLCYLTDYLSLVYVLPLTIFWVRATKGWDRPKVVSFMAGLALVALPWWFRNTRLGGNPFYSFQWLEIATRTDGFPGLSLYRDIHDTVPGVVLLSPGVFPFFKKLISGLTDYFFQAPFVPHLYLAPFVVVAFWQRSANRLIEACKWGTLVAWVLYVLALVTFGRVAVSFLVPLAPLISLIGALSLMGISKNWVNRWIALKTTSKEVMTSKSLYRIYGTFGAAIVLFLLFPLAPMAKEVWRLHKQPPQSQEVIEQFCKQLPEKRAVVTDVPWLVAWYGDHSAVWIPNRLADLETIEARQPVGAVYLSAALRTYGPEENVGEWQQNYSKVRDISGYRTDARPSTGDILYHKYATLAEAEQLARQKPRDPAALADLGRARLAAAATAKEPQSAMADANKALEAFLAAQHLSPRAAGPYRGAGVAYFKLRRFPDSARAFEKALELDPDDLPSRMGLADLYTALHRRRAAIDLYERVLADHPNHVLAVNNLAYLYAEDNRDLNRALEMGRRSVAANPQNAMMWDTLGWAAFRLRRYDDAVSSLEAAGNFAPRNPLIYYHLGRAYAAKGDVVKARTVLEVALAGRRLLTPEDGAAAEATFMNLRSG